MGDRTDRLVAQTHEEQAVLIEDPHHASALRGRDEVRGPHGKTSGHTVRGGWREGQVVSQILTRERMRDFVRRKEIGGGLQMSSLQRCGKSGGPDP